MAAADGSSSGYRVPAHGKNDEALAPEPASGPDPRSSFSSGGPTAAASSPASGAAVSITSIVFVTLSGRGALLLAPPLPHCGERSVAVAGLTLGADPMVSWVAHAAALAGRDLDALIVRKEAKGHGTGAWLEKPLPAVGARITLLEDVVTMVISPWPPSAATGRVQLQRVVAIVDREEVAAALQQEGLELHSPIASVRLQPCMTPLQELSRDVAFNPCCSSAAASCSAVQSASAGWSWMRCCTASHPGSARRRWGGSRHSLSPPPPAWWRWPR